LRSRYRLLTKGILTTSKCIWYQVVLPLTYQLSPLGSRTIICMYIHISHPNLWTSLYIFIHAAALVTIESRILKTATEVEPTANKTNSCNWTWLADFALINVFSTKLAICAQIEIAVIGIGIRLQVSDRIGSDRIGLELGLKSRRETSCVGHQLWMASSCRRG